MKPLSTIWLLAVAAACAAGARTFATAATVTRMGDTLEDAALYLQSLSPPSQCVFGHLETPVQTWFPGGGTLDYDYYSLLGHPHEDCPLCTFGFRVRTIHLLLHVSDATTLVGTVGLADASLHEVGCASPLPFGPPDCEAEYHIDVPGPGFYDIAIPVECGCAVSSFYPYLIDFGAGAVNGVDVLLDAECNWCTGWVVDLTSIYAPWWDRCNVWGIYALPGDVIYYVEADCCEQPVADKISSWSTLKVLFGP